MNGYEQDGMHDAMAGKFLPMYSIANGIGIEVLPNLYCYTDQIVNIVFVGDHTEDFVLVDTGMPGSSEKILEVV